MNDNVRPALKKSEITKKLENLKSNSYEDQLLVFGKSCFNLGAVYGFGVGKTKGKTLKALMKWLETKESSDYLIELVKGGKK